MSVSRKGVVAGVIGTCTALFLVWIVVVPSLLLCFRIRISGSVYGSQLKHQKCSTISHSICAHMYIIHFSKFGTFLCGLIREKRHQFMGCQNIAIKVRDVSMAGALFQRNAPKSAATPDLNHTFVLSNYHNTYVVTSLIFCLGASPVILPTQHCYR